MSLNVTNTVAAIKHYYDDVKLHGESLVVPVRYCSLGVTQLWRAPWHYDNKMARLVELVCRAAAAIICSGLFIPTAAISLVGLSIKCIDESRQPIKPGSGKDQVESMPSASSSVVLTPAPGPAPAPVGGNAAAAIIVEQPEGLLKTTPASPRQAQKAQGNILDMSRLPVDLRGVIDVPGDGHCLYYSMCIGLSFLLPELQKLELPDGCVLPANGGTLPGVPALRKLANDFIREKHATDPALQGYVREAIAAANAKYSAEKDGANATTNFLFGEKSIIQVACTQRLAEAEHKYRSINNPEEYFVRAMEEPAFWGSQAEFYALSHIYQTTIQIIDEVSGDLIRAREPVNPEYSTQGRAVVRLVGAGGHFKVMQPGAEVREVVEEDRANILALLAIPDE